MATERTLHLLTVLVSLVCAYAAPSDPKEGDRGEGPYTLSFGDRNSVFQDWKKQFAEIHGNDWDEATRFAIFSDNLVDMEEHNHQYHIGNSTFYMGLNQFSAMTHDEYMRYNHLGQYSSKDIHVNPEQIPHKDVSFDQEGGSGGDPNSVDWTAAGYVTPIKNQYQCGSCWIFSGIGALEGAYYKTHRQLKSFSEQQVLDCCQLDHCGKTCADAGYSEAVYQYVTSSHGIELEQEYPYTGQKSGQCRIDHSKAIGAVTSINRVTPSGNEEALRSASARVGPISVAIDSNHPEFRNYKGGVIDVPNCSRTRTDHVVLLTGYGTTSNNVDYWIIKNSWGTSWGLNGYGHMSRNKGSQCAIADYANYPSFQ